MIVMSKTPMRISFLGGGSDLPDFYHNEMGAVLSTAIDKYVHIVVNPLSTLFTYRYRISYSKVELVNYLGEIQHPLVREALRFVCLEEPLEIHSIADIPAGTGIGSSSAFTVGLLNALHAYKGQPILGEQLAEEAADIEMIRLAEPIGKQDHYISALGGFRLTRFYPDGSVQSDPVPVSEELRAALFQRLMLFYTGLTRRASEVLAEQKARLSEGMGRDVLRKMVSLTLEAAALLEEGGELSYFGKLLHEGWQLKKRMASTISNSQLDGWYEAARRAGAVGGKLLGAGGGGFFLFYVDPEYQSATERALAPLRRVPFKWESRGSWIAYTGD